MKTIINKITNMLIDTQAISIEDKKLYEYAIRSLIINISPLIMVLFIGLVMGIPIEGIMMITPFMIIRKYSGGYHAKNALACFVLSFATIAVCMVLIQYFLLNGIPLIITLLSMGSLITFSPIDSLNRKLERDEKKHYKNICCMLVIFIGAVSIGFALLHQEKYATSSAMGLVLAAISQIPYILQSILKHRCRLNAK